MSHREWFPADWVDEVCPPSKAAPEAFVVAVIGSGYKLGYAADDKSALDEDRDYFDQPIELGDIVSFVSCDRYDDVEVTLRRDGTYELHGVIPAEHNTVIIDGDIDTLHEGFAALIEAIKTPGDEFHISTIIFDDGKDECQVTLSLARWSDPLPHRFDIENGKPIFRQTQIN